MRAASARKVRGRKYKRHSEQQIRRLLDNVASAVKRGKSIADACLGLGISEASYYRWRTVANEGTGPARQGNRAQSRERIILAAKDLFLREGRAVGLDSVASTAGVARQTLYNLFGNREQLFSAVVNSIYVDRLESVLHIDAKGGLRPTLINYGRQVIAVGLDPEITNLLRLTVSELHEFPHYGKVLWSHVSRTAPVLADYFRAQIEAGHLRPFDTMVAAEAFVGALTSAARYRALVGVGEEPPERREATLHFVVDAFIRGLVTTEKQKSR